MVTGRAMKLRVEVEDSVMEKNGNRFVSVLSGSGHMPAVDEIDVPGVELRVLGLDGSSIDHVESLVSKRWKLFARESTDKALESWRSERREFSVVVVGLRLGLFRMD